MRPPVAAGPIERNLSESKGDWAAAAVAERRNRAGTRRRTGRCSGPGVKSGEVTPSLAILLADQRSQTYTPGQWRVWFSKDAKRVFDSETNVARMDLFSIPFPLIAAEVGGLSAKPA